MYSAGIDIGGTKIRLGLFAGDGTLIARRKDYISEIADIPFFIGEALKALCEESGISGERLTFCGAAIPGTVDASGKKIVKAPNIAGLTENFAERLEERIGLSIHLIQDSRAAAWGEYVAGKGRGMSSIICFTLGTGIGTGIVENGKIYHGKLGCAGELGHIPVKENGRECGCGKNGCLEKYCAGGGLDITAAELFGEGKTAADLFNAAKQGDAAAQKAIGEAVRLLGRAIVSAVNLLSPEGVFFSGGLVAQREMYIDPLTEYVKTHCYRANGLPVISVSGLGEMAPLYGAGLLKRPAERKETRLSASIMCADVLDFRKALREIEEAGIQYVHCDIMDNHFVPNLMLPAELLNKLHEATSLPFDYHIMADDAEGIIERLEIREGDIVSVHFEASVHLMRAIALIKEKGAQVSVALNPATPVEVLSEVVSYIDMVLVMTVNPGFSGQKLVPSAFDKIRRTREFLDARGLRHIGIEADGNCSFENVPKMRAAGADIFVVGTSSVFAENMTVFQGTKKLLAELREC